MLCAQERVRRRIPLFNINAYMYNTLMSRCTRTDTFTQSTLAHAPNSNTVEYAVQLHHPPPTHIMETEPALGRDNLFLVRWRHGNDPVRKFNTALQKLDLSVVEQSVKEGAIGQPKVPRFRHPEIPCASAMRASQCESAGVCAFALVGMLACAHVAISCIVHVCMMRVHRACARHSMPRISTCISNYTYRNIPCCGCQIWCAHFCSSHIDDSAR